jgi:hypothetical protein
MILMIINVHIFHNKNEVSKSVLKNKKILLSSVAVVPHLFFEHKI